MIDNVNKCVFLKLLRGIRQRCPISPYLFLIAVEVLANDIRKDTSIKRIHVGDVELKISHLVEDTTVLVSYFDSVGNAL